MTIQTSARNFALQNKLNLGRNHLGYYFLRTDGKVSHISIHPTAQSALAMMRRVVK